LNVAEAWCRSKAVDCLYLLADPDDAPTVRLAEQSGFRLVDLRLTLRRRLGNEHLSVQCTEATIRRAMAGDIASLRALAGKSHRDSRFYFDGTFPRERCDALYETWIEKSCAGFADVVLVAERQGDVVGYITSKALEPALGQIGLLAVDERAAGLGLGGALVSEALKWSRDRGHTAVRVVTQGRNLRAQRCYQRAGFVSDSLFLSYHRWFAGGSEAGASGAA
jgi:dTDP-4-amino-4,6-dideoxy-D-galactose acyltransferase